MSEINIINVKADLWSDDVEITVEVNNKYFTPDISDIRIGYECEHYSKITTNGHFDISPENGIVTSDYQWRPYKFRQSTFCYTYKGELRTVEDNIVIGDLSSYRTQYLTKEQIEAEGWHKSFEDIEFYWKNWDDRHGDNHYLLKLKENNVIQIESIKDFREDAYFTLYEGICKDINTFRYMCKLLGINQNNAINKDKQEDKQ